MNKQARARPNRGNWLEGTTELAEPLFAEKIMGGFLEKVVPKLRLEFSPENIAVTRGGGRRVFEVQEATHTEAGPDP